MYIGERQRLESVLDNISRQRREPTYAQYARRPPTAQCAAEKRLYTALSDYRMVMNCPDNL